MFLLRERCHGRYHNALSVHLEPGSESWIEEQEHSLICHLDHLYAEPTVFFSSHLKPWKESRLVNLTSL